MKLPTRLPDRLEDDVLSDPFAPLHALVARGEVSREQVNRSLRNSAEMLGHLLERPDWRELAIASVDAWEKVMLLMRRHLDCIEHPESREWTDTEVLIAAMDIMDIFEPNGDCGKLKIGGEPIPEELHAAVVEHHRCYQAVCRRSTN